MSKATPVTILVVEDSRLVGTALARSLGTRAHLLAAHSGEQALERLLLDATVDAVVCDLGLPGMSGEHLLARVRGSRDARIRGLPFLVLSGSDDQNRAARLLAAGASAFIAKQRAGAELMPALLANVTRLSEPPEPPEPPEAPEPARPIEAGERAVPGRPMEPAGQAEPAESIEPAGQAKPGIEPTGQIEPIGHLEQIEQIKPVNPPATIDVAARPAGGCWLRLRWQISPAGKVPGSEPLGRSNGLGAPPVTLPATLNREVRDGDYWRPDTDGCGGVVRLDCPIEHSLRPLLRLAGRLRSQAEAAGMKIAVSIRLLPGDHDDAGPVEPASLAAAPTMPEVDQMSIALPNGQFRLDLVSAP